MQSNGRDLSAVMADVKEDINTIKEYLFSVESSKFEDAAKQVHSSSFQNQI